MMLMVTQFILSFVAVFFKGMQSQNIIGGRYLAAFMNSYFIAGFDVIVITLTVEVGYMSVFPIATGASLGVVSSIWVYRRINKVA